MSPLPKGFSGHINLIKPHLVFKDDVAVIQYVCDEYETVYSQNLHTTYAAANTWIRKDTLWQLLASQIFEVPQLPPAIKPDATILKRYTGVYQMTDTITCTISLENDTLFMQKKGRTREALFPETTNIFFKLSDTRGRKFFVEDDQGNMLMRERRNGEDLVWKRIKH